MSRFKKMFVVFLLDLLIIQFSIFLSFSLRYGELIQPIGSQWIIYIVGTLLLFPIFLYFGLYSGIFRQTGLKTLITILKATIVYALFFFISLSILQFVLVTINSSFTGSIPRSLGIIHPLIFYTLINSTRIFITYYYQYIKLKESKQNIIIYGAGENGAQLLKVLENNAHIFAFVDDDEAKQNKIINGIKVYNYNQLDKLIKRYEITDIMVSISNLNPIERNIIYKRISSNLIRIRFMPNVFNLISNPNSILALQEIKIEDLLERNILIDSSKTDQIKNSNVLISGGGGSIGSELSRQLAILEPKNLVLIDHSEINLFNIYQELKLSISKTNKSVNIVPILLNLKNRKILKKIFLKYRFDYVFHAAAYKHVDLVENNVMEAIGNNVFNTKNIADIAYECDVNNFVLVSTDKAVRPSTVMGATKKLAELYVQGISNISSKKNNTKFSIVRFGNVLNSSGSVVPLFKNQILSGGPITVTHPEVSRFFMTIPEAVKLILETCFTSSGGEVFVLNMGEPVKIINLARKMIFLSGLLEKNELSPLGDIEIKIIGLKPEEKLSEELLIEDSFSETKNKYIMVEKTRLFNFDKLVSKIILLEEKNNLGNSKKARESLFEIIKGYK
ncbi:polysaccharide biosynthesis protein [Pelagibacterales bacterium]|nr:polysaccharide biosynthesis protein [Pelagibacterales bacterium]